MGVFVLVVAGDVLTLDAHASLPVATELPLRWETERGPVEATVEVLRCDPLEVRLAAARDAPEVRSAPRFAAPLQVRATVRRSSVMPAGTRVSGALVDVSACGLGFTPNAPLGTGSLVLLTLVTPSGAQCGRAVDAVVLRVETQVGGTDVAGCRFAASQPDLLRAVQAHQAVAAWRRSA